MSLKTYQPLSAKEIQEYFKRRKRKINICKYKDLAKAEKISKKMLPMLILIDYGVDVGHWVALLDHKNYLEYFDSYGNLPDALIDQDPELFREVNGYLYPHITYLLYNWLLRHPDCIVEYNHKKLQSDDTMCCGRWCTHRVFNKHLKLDEYLERVAGIDDEKITYLTLSL